MHGLLGVGADHRPCLPLGEIVPSVRCDTAVMRLRNGSVQLEEARFGRVSTGSSASESISWRFREHDVPVARWLGMRPRLDPFDAATLPSSAGPALSRTGERSAGEPGSWHARNTSDGGASSHCVVIKKSAGSPVKGAYATVNPKLTCTAISVPGPRGGGEQPMTLAP